MTRPFSYRRGFRAAFVIRVRFTEAKSLTSIDAHMHRASIVSRLISLYGITGELQTHACMPTYVLLYIFSYTLNI